MNLRSLSSQSTIVLITALLAGCPDDGTEVTPGSESSSSSGGPTTNATVTQTTSVDTTVDTTDTDAESSSTTDEPSTEESGSTSEGGPSCGDDVADRGEECDGTDLAGADCASQGFDGGTLACAANCTFDTSGCTSAACGNGEVDLGEQCDGADLDGADCIALGFDSGTLGCNADCTVDTTGCNSAVCGDGSIKGIEVCDGANLDGEDCVSLGFDVGTLACSGDCLTFDTSGCIDINCCLDNGGLGCNDAACEAAVCAADSSCCDTAWTEACADAAFDLCPALCPVACGDDYAYGTEACDGADLEGQDCASFGFDGGTLVCADDCSGFDSSGCIDYDCCFANGGTGCNVDACEATVCAIDSFCCDTNWDNICVGEAFDFCPEICVPVCGDGTIQGLEQCDGANLDFQDCTTQGFDGGTLACDPVTCQYDLSDCADAVCGDGVVDSPEVCDGANLDGQTCASLGWSDTPDSDCCEANGGLGCGNDECEAAVCAIDSTCCDTAWDDSCATTAATECELLCDGLDLACNGGCGSFDTSACYGLPGCVEEDIDSNTGTPVATGDTSSEDSDFTQSCGSTDSPDHVVYFTAPAADTYLISTDGSSIDTVLEVYSDCFGTPLACDDDGDGPVLCGGFNCSEITIDLAAGQGIMISVSGYGAGVGAWELNINAI